MPAAADGGARGPTVLVVAGSCPFPPVHGNRRRLLAWFAWLRQRGCRVVFLLQPTDVEDPASIARLADVVDDVVVAAPPRTAVRDGLAEVLGRMPVLWRLRTPLREGPRRRPCWTTTQRAFRDIVRREAPSVVISAYVHFASCLRDAGGALRVIDTVEIFQRGAGERARLGFTIPVDADRESRAWSAADVLVAIQPNDAAFLRERFPAKRVVVVGIGSPMEGAARGAPEPGLVLCVGSENQFNRHGLALFLRESWPAIRAAVPHARLHVVGGVGRGHEKAGDGVVVHGHVGDDALARLYRRAHVVVNPQVEGTGLKTKCVEALRAGCPLVTRRAGADGMEDGAGSGFLCAEDAAQFTAYVLAILGDDVLRRSLERGAQEFAQARFAEATLFGDFAEVLAAVTPAQPRRGQ